MTTELDVDLEEQDHGHHPPTTVRQYIIIGAILTVVTLVELWASYNEELLGVTLIPALIIMSAFKFIVVVALFMHLKFEHPLLTRLFLFGFLLATAIMIALLALFWGNDSIIRGTFEASAGAGAAGH